MDREIELRTHIRELLLQYALTHLATNHVAWTQDTVADLLSGCLLPAPLTGPTSVALPVDPLEYLSQKWGLPKLNIYEERWEVSNPEAIPYLRKQLACPPRRPERVVSSWHSDVDEQYEAFSQERPMSPILTARARRETPRPGQSIHAVRFPRTRSQLPSYCGFEPIEIPSPKDEPLNVDDVLGNKLAIEQDTTRAILEFINSVPMTSGQPSAVPAIRTFDGFLRADSPLPDLPEPEMVPVFSRGRRPGRFIEKADEPFATSLHAISNLSSSWLYPVSLKEEEENLADAHLDVVDGWHALKTFSSPPGTPSLADSSSEMDELFMLSSDADLDDAALFMEEFQFPRTEKIGGARNKPSLPGENSNLSAFLSPLLRPFQVCGPRIVHSPQSQPSSPRTTITMSMLGQPPSAVDAQSAVSMPGDDHSSDDSIAFAIKTVERACGDCLGDEDLAAMIIGERLDEKDSLLMDVPIMRPPNEHAPDDTALPTRLADLLAPANFAAAAAASGGCAAYCSGFLKKVKGLQPLQIELSWIPFKYGRTVPTDEEVADVANDPGPQLAKSIDLAQDELVSRLAELLDESMAFSSQPIALDAVPSTNIWAAEDNSEIPLIGSLAYTEDAMLILARGDRRRLAGLPALPRLEEGEEDTGGSDKETDCVPLTEYHTDSNGSCPTERPKKRVRFQEDLGFAHFVAIPDDAAIQLELDDSGVFLNEQQYSLSDDGRNSFEQLAYNSEGFAGPEGDGDVFPDMHYMDNRFDFSPTQLPGISTLNELDYSLPSPSPPDSRVLGGNGICEMVTVAADTHVLQPCLNGSQQMNMSPIPASNLPDDAAAAVIPPASHDLPTYDTTVRLSSSPKQSVLSARQSLAHFLAFCGKAPLVKIGNLPTPTSLAGESAQSVPAVHNEDTRTSILRDTPPELLDDRTWVLPPDYEPPAMLHRYMASLDLIQKRALVRALSSYCTVDLVERVHLGEEVHLILDCDTAVLFVALEMLPARGDVLVALLTRLSWRYSRLLIVFECYPSAWDFRGGRDRDLADRPVASAWSPPVVKAVKRLKRDLSIAEGLQTKCTRMVVEYAFANTVEEAAAFARMYGDAAQARDSTSGAVWGERHWLTPEEHDGEYDLCGVEGMNIFAASLLLSQVTLEDFLEKSADDRFLEYGDLIGTERVTRFNSEMLRRLEAMQLPPSSPIPDVSSSMNSVPYYINCDDQGPC